MVAFNYSYICVRSFVLCIYLFFFAYALRIASYLHVRLLASDSIALIPPVLLSFWLFCFMLWFTIIVVTNMSIYSTDAFVTNYKLCMHFFSASSLLIWICPPVKRISDSTCAGSVQLAQIILFGVMCSLAYLPHLLEHRISVVGFNEMWYIPFIRPSNSKFTSNN